MTSQNANIATPPHESGYSAGSKHIVNRNLNDFTIRLLIANIIAELLVITNHYTSFNDAGWKSLGIDITSLPLSNCLNWLSSSYFFAGATSVFFLISGFLFFRNYDKPGAYRGKLKRRLFTLGLPYLLWNLIASPWVITFFTIIFKREPLSFAEIFGSATIWEVFVGKHAQMFPADAPLWFMRELMIMCIIAPAIYRFMHIKASPLILLGEFAAWRMATILVGGWYDGFLQSLFFFSLGAYICIHGIEPFSCWKKYLWPAIIFLVIHLICIKIWEHNVQYWIGFTDLAKVTIIMTVSNYLSRQRYGVKIAFFGSATFFLYVTHTIFLWQTQSFFFKILKPTSDIATLATIFFTEIATLSCLLIIWELLSRLTPQIAYALTGGRSRIRSRFAHQGRTEG